MVLWQIHRRPRGRMLWFSIVLGMLYSGGSTLLIHALLIDGDWLISSAAIAAGVGLGLFLVLSLLHGCSVRILRGGRLIYALRGHDCVAVDLRQVTAMHSLQTGVLSGIGLVAPLTALEFLSRKGVSRTHCATLHERHGVALVLEFLLPSDLAPLQAAWHESLLPVAGTEIDERVCNKPPPSAM